MSYSESVVVLGVYFIFKKSGDRRFRPAARSVLYIFFFSKK